MRVLHVESSYALTLLPYSIKAYVDERSSDLHSPCLL